MQGFYLVIGLTHNIETCKVFSMLHFVTQVHFAIIITKLNARIFTTANAYASSH